MTAVIAVAEGGDFAARRGGIYVFGGSVGHSELRQTSSVAVYE